MPFTAAQRTDAYRFFAIAFGAAPGVTHLRDIEFAYEGGQNTRQVVNTYTTKAAFKAIYPDTATDAEFAVALVNNVVGTAATNAAKQQAMLDIAVALKGGATRGDVIVQVFNNLAQLKGDTQWGALAAKLEKQVTVAQFYTETLGGGSGTVDQLRAVIAGVDGNTDVSTAALTARLAPSATVALGGKVIDGYVRGATVFVDYNGNGVADTADEKSTLTTTDKDGNFKLNAPKAGGTLVASGGVNIDTGNANTLVLKAPAKEGQNSTEAGNVLTPLTTLVTAVASQGLAAGAAPSGAQLAEAEAKVKASFGLPASVSLLTIDPVAVANSTTASAADKSAALQVFKAGVSVAVVAAAAQGLSTDNTVKADLAAAVTAKLVSDIASGTTGLAGDKLTGVVLTVATQKNLVVSTDALITASQALTSVASSATTAAVAVVQNTVEDKLNPINIAPVFTFVADAVSVAENTTTVGTIAAIDDGSVTYSVSGANAALFTIDAKTGALAFVNAPNFEALTSKAIAVTVDATDDKGLKTSKALTVNVTDVNEAPTISIAPGTVSVAENSTAVGTFAAADVDAGDVLTYTLGGAQAALFNINSATGAVTFKAAPDFEGTPGPGPFSFSVTATDKGGLSATGTVSVAVTNVVSETFSTTAGVPFVGTSDADIIIGSAGNDSISAGAGNDTITGNGGNDTIVGGAGVDQITLGTGDSLVVFAAGDSGALAQFTGTIGVSALDVVSGFNAGDTIRLPFTPSGIASTPSGTAIALISGNYTAATSLFTVGSGPDAILAFDANGGGVIQAVVLVGLPAGAITGATGGTGGTGATGVIGG